MPRVSFEGLVRFAQEYFAAKGVPEERARTIAETAVTTEAFGITTHGLSFLPYAEGAIPGVLDPKDMGQADAVREILAACRRH